MEWTAVAVIFVLWSLAIAAMEYRVRVTDRRVQRLRHEQDQERERHGESLAALKNVTSDGLVLLDRQAGVVWVNQVAHELLGAADGADASARQAIGDLDLRPLVDQALNGPGDTVGQTIVKADRTFAVRVSAVGQGGEGGVLVGLDEVTELQRLGRARREFVANISHELRTPVTTLQVLIETFSPDTLGDRALVFDLLSKMRSQIDLLRQLTDELMDLALIESGQAPLKLLETPAADLVRTAVEALRPQAERKQIAIEAAIPPDLVVFADAQGIRKVLGNLLHNAIKYTAAGGHISLRAERRDDTIEFAVCDTGSGIPAGDLPRVFERFYKVSRARERVPGEAGGTGLGLAIAKHIVGAHGGQIWAESVQGQGSTFHFTLPAAE